MDSFHVFFAVLSAITLFLFGLQGFSTELQKAGGAALRHRLSRITSNRWRGFLVGAGATALIQSSSAVTALTVALVNTRAIGFLASLGVLLGANVGTTATAWLVSMKLTGIGPIFIVAGAIIGTLPTRLKLWGEAIFYFGFIFFTLDLIGAELKPLHEDPLFTEVLRGVSTPLAGVLAGALLTAVVQSSSVTTGLVIILVQQNLMMPEAAIAIVMGANIGTTATGLIASIGMRRTARNAAAANLVLKTAGVLLFFPFLAKFASLMAAIDPQPAMMVAWAHLIFNLVVSIGFLLMLPLFERPIARWLGESDRIA